jgi:hypothetical protein
MKIKFFNVANFLLVVLLLFFVINRSVAVPPAISDGMFIINEDAFHFYFTRTLE